MWRLFERVCGAGLTTALLGTVCCKSFTKMLSSASLHAHLSPLTAPHPSWRPGWTARRCDAAAPTRAPPPGGLSERPAVASRPVRLPANPTHKTAVFCDSQHFRVTILWPTPVQGQVGSAHPDGKLISRIIDSALGRIAEHLPSLPSAMCKPGGGGTYAMDQESKAFKKCRTAIPAPVRPAWIPARRRRHSTARRPEAGTLAPPARLRGPGCRSRSSPPSGGASALMMCWTPCPAAGPMLWLRWCASCPSQGGPAPCSYITSPCTHQHRHSRLYFVVSSVQADSVAEVQ